MKLPQEFIESMTAHLGKDEFDNLSAALQSEPPVSIRFNPEKINAAEIEGMINEHNATRVPWCDLGYYLNERPQFTFDPLLHAGCYYVQEASSMFLWHILSKYIETRKHCGNLAQEPETSPITALDLCAAPGGKSTIALSLLPEDSVLIANEAIRQRSNILAENIIKWGMPNCIVTNNYAEDFKDFTATFDIIICDVPCSGEGMFRKDHNSINEWSASNVAACCKTQKDIVNNIWHTLKEGGLLIYSTCTYNPHEDEENVEWIAKNLGAEILSCNAEEGWHLTEKHTHFYPHIIKGEGFFVSILRKKGNEEKDTGCTANKKKGIKNKQQSKSKIPQELRGWINTEGNLTIYEDNGSYRAFPMAHKTILQRAQNSLRIVHSGIELAKPKGKGLQPSHSLAMSTLLNRNAFPHVELTRQQALAYLRTEALTLPEKTPAGYVLLTYKGHPIGFAKNIGNRANNLYPSEWKIRSSHIPNAQQ